MTELVVIQPSDPHWAEEFALLRGQFALALDGLAAAIEHVGSTAVPGLAAKPILDVDVLLLPGAEFAVVATRLASLGYEHKGDLGVTGREAFRAPRGAVPHHLYVCPFESREYRRHIAFRDHLRSHPADAAAYASLKRKLAAGHATDREAYTQGKSGFIEAILRRADPSLL